MDLMGGIGAELRDENAEGSIYPSLNHLSLSLHYHTHTSTQTAAPPANQILVHFQNQ